MNYSMEYITIAGYSFILCAALLVVHSSELYTHWGVGGGAKVGKGCRRGLSIL